MKKNIITIMFVCFIVTVWGQKSSLTIDATQKENDVKIQVDSRSRGGQIKDWGANEYNVTRLKDFLQDPNMELGKRVVPGEKSGRLFLLIFVVIFIIIFIILTTL